MPHWSDLVIDPEHRPARGTVHRLGVLPGEGVGPEVTGVALQVLAALEGAGLANLEVEILDRIGHATNGDSLPHELVAFCTDTFAAGGAILAGPYGGRFVYDLRRRFDLYCKLSPLKPSPALQGVVRMRPEAVAGIDLLIVRENMGDAYQGEWSESVTPEHGRVAEHRFRYTETQVRRILHAAARLAARRRGLLAVVAKPGGLPAMSRLWVDCARDIGVAEGVTCEVLDVDYAAYRLVQHAAELDVVVAPNVAGDILCDLGSVLLGSRGLSFGGSFAANGAAVYQTNHGAAFDLAGSGRANPAGHLYALAMLLRESFGLGRAAGAIESALDEVWAEGYRTTDVAEPGALVVSLAEIGERVAAAVGARRAGQPLAP